MPVLRGLWNRRGFWGLGDEKDIRELFRRKSRREETSSSATSSTSASSSSSSASAQASASSTGSSISSSASASSPVPTSLSASTPTPTASAPFRSASSVSPTTSAIPSTTATASTTSASPSASASTSAASSSSSIVSSASASSAALENATASSNSSSFTSSSITSSSISTSTSSSISISSSKANAPSSPPARVVAATSSVNNLLVNPSSTAVFTFSAPSSTTSVAPNPTTSKAVNAAAAQTAAGAPSSVAAAADTAPSTTAAIGNGPATTLSVQQFATAGTVPTVQPSPSSGVTNASGPSSNLSSTSHVNVPVVAGVTSVLGTLLLLLVAAVLIVRRRSRRQTNAWRDRLLGGRMFAGSPTPSMSSSHARTPFFRSFHRREPSFPIQPPEMEETRVSYRTFAGKHQVTDSLTRPLNSMPNEPQWDLVAGPSLGLGNYAETGGDGLGSNFGRAPALAEAHDSFYASDPFAAPSAPTVIPPSSHGHGTSAGSGGSLSTLESRYSEETYNPPGRGASPYAM